MLDFTKNKLNLGFFWGRVGRQLCWGISCTSDCFSYNMTKKRFSKHKWLDVTSHLRDALNKKKLNSTLVIPYFASSF